MRELLRIDGVPVMIDDTDGSGQWVAGAMIDGDGCPRCYGPNGKGLDDLRNAGSPGNWYGLVTDQHGNPVVQGPNDPEPGYYVSATAYQWPNESRTSPRRYVDSEKVPFIVVSPLIRKAFPGIVLGCRARATLDSRTVICVVADIGPHNRIGELSIAAAVALGIPSSPRNGGEERKIIQYDIWPGVAANINGVEYQLQAA